MRVPALPASWAPLRELVGASARRFFAREDVQFIGHCVFLLVLLAFLRPLLNASVPNASYEAPTIVGDLIKRDLASLAAAVRHQRPVVSRALFLVVPTVALLIAGRSGRRVTWSRWESGRSLRAFVMTLLIMMAWAGSTFEYNIYLNRGHAFDRLLLVALTALSWRTPLAVPFATRLSIIMLKEGYVPIPIDDFDFRAVAEVLIVFSCFVWASVRRTFATKHFLLAALGCWASYYYAAGVAKWTHGPAYSWLLDNHLSNLASAAHVRGWLGFIPDDVHGKIIAFVRRFDVVLAGFTLVVELGSLALFFVHPRATRAWLLLCFLFQFGIYALTGICFWKWMVTSLAFWVFLRRGGAVILQQMCRHKAVILFAIASVYFSRQKLYYYPQTRVVWYDSKLMENYLLYAVGPSGQRYLVDPSSLTPTETHWVQGRLCYATDEKSLTSIYGSTGSHEVLMAFERLESPQDALRLLARRGRSCTDPERKEVFNRFFSRYFGNLNRHGRPHHWLSWIGAPRHLWIQPRGDRYELQEPVVRIELWRELVVKHQDAMHPLEKKLVHELPIPLDGAEPSLPRL